VRKSGEAKMENTLVLMQGLKLVLRGKEHAFINEIEGD